MKNDPSDLPVLLDELEAAYGPPPRPVPKGALEWILWENCAYLVPDERRAKAFRALKRRTKARGAGILALPREDLGELARLGGMMPDKRVEKLLTIAELVRDEFGGDLEPALELPLPKARRALQRFPGIGRPGADKILLFTGAHVVPALESNGLRVLTRLGWVEEARNYSTTYNTATKVLGEYVDRGGPWLARAYQLLRKHGQETCKDNGPHCDECAVVGSCPSAT